MRNASVGPVAEAVEKLDPFSRSNAGAGIIITIRGAKFKTALYKIVNTVLFDTFLHTCCSFKIFVFFGLVL